MASLGVERISLTIEALTALGFPVKHHDQVTAGFLLGTGIDLIWAYGGPALQTLDLHGLEHYHASLALFMFHDPVATGTGIALLGPDIVGAFQHPTNPFGLADPEPFRSTNIAVGLIELGVLAAQHLSRKKRR